MSRVGRRILVIVGGIGICIAIAGGRWVGAADPRSDGTSIGE